MKGPVDFGALDLNEDALSEKSLQLGVRSFLAKQGQEGEADFGSSLVALASTPD